MNSIYSHSRDELLKKTVEAEIKDIFPSIRRRLQTQLRAYLCKLVEKAV